RARGQRIEQRPASGKVSCKIGNCGNHRVEGCPLSCAATFIVRKKEDLVPSDWATEGCSELIPLQWRNTGGKEVARLDFLIAKEFIGAAVESVAAALQCRVDDRREGVLRAHPSAEDLELFNRVSGGCDGSGAEFVLRDVKTVEEPAPGQPAAAA